METEQQLHVGDTIAVARSGHSAGSCDAAARVLEVISEAGTGSFYYRVSWSTGFETIYRPGRDVRVLEDQLPFHPTKRRTTAVTG